MRRFTPALLILALSAACSDAPPQSQSAGEKRAACASRDALRRPFFGDTHVHTAFSFDASSQDTRNTPRDAYRFAKGARVGLQPYDEQGKAQRSAKLQRPLDFAVVTDHAEGLGEVRICRDPKQPGYQGDFCWMYRNFGAIAFNVMAIRTIIARDRFAFCGENDRRCLEQAAVVWGEIQAAAEEAYDRSANCSFTSFIGYEWTASTVGGANLHRNVVFKNEKVPAYPPSWVETPSAFALWQRLQSDCIEGTPGCDALTIPHNSNLSGPGLIFESARLQQDSKLHPVDKEEAQLRQRWEPLVEIMQHKGDSECLLGGDTKDEACAFEKLPYGSFAGVGRFRSMNLSGAGADADTSPKRSATVREALKQGLVLQSKVGVNPLRYGIVASTDTHLGTPGLVAEGESMGHGGAGMQGGGAAGLPDNIEFNPGGLAVLWAEENTRESLFAAMQRREAYGTSGTRPTVRMFGGWNYPQNMCSEADFVARGYAGGVPMGGDLPAPPAAGASGAAPRLAVWALQDPGSDAQPGTPLNRVQIVKGWIEQGKARERVFDIASSGQRASVDPATCKQRGSGAKQLCAVWSDPDFDANAGAFYYARVLENPSCRWSQQLCAAAKINCAEPESVPPGYAACCAPDHRPVVQERAWTSPIWFTPKAN